MRPRVGISRCLLGAPVRYDGAHRLEPGLLDALGPYVEWVDVCPEMEAGMGVPREPVRLLAAGVPGQPRMVGVHSGRDWSVPMTRWSAARIEELRGLGLSGYILKARSPSCGPRDVPIHEPVDGAPGTAASGPGLFAAALVAAFPGLPIADEEDLRRPNALDSFLERVRAFGVA